MTRFQSV